MFAKNKTSAHNKFQVESNNKNGSTVLKILDRGKKEKKKNFPQGTERTGKKKRKGGSSGGDGGGGNGELGVREKGE